MSGLQAMVDGEPMPVDQARVPVTDPGFTHGWSAFETVRVEAGLPRRLDAHLDRLAGSCEAMRIAMPARELLTREVEAIAAGLPDLGRVRITLTGGGHRVLVGETMDRARIHRPIRAIRGVHRNDPYLPGSVKHGSRAGWVVAVKRAGVDDVLLVDESGRFTEATTAAILAVREGVLWTAPDDGRILASTTCADVLDRAARLGIPVRREGPPASGPWDGLYVASALRDLAPVAELDGVALTGWEPIGRRLAGLDAG